MRDCGTKYCSIRAFLAQWLSSQTFSLRVHGGVSLNKRYFTPTFSLDPVSCTKSYQLSCEVFQRQTSVLGVIYHHLYGPSWLIKKTPPLPFLISVCLQDRGQVFVCLDKVSTTHVLVRPCLEVKRRLLEMMLHSCTSDIRDSGEWGSRL